MGFNPHHLICDNSQLWDFLKSSKDFCKQILKWQFELIHLGFLLSHFKLFLKKIHDASLVANPSTYLTEGCDNSPPLKRISSRYSEVIGRKVGYSALRRSSLS